MNPHYLAAKNREIPPEKRLRRRKDGDFRDVDDMHTANYYFENGKKKNYPLKKRKEKVLTELNIEMRKVKPYYFEYKSFAKGRWFDRAILEVFSSEFRDRSVDYYVTVKLYLLQKKKLTLIYSVMRLKNVYLQLTINK